MFITFLTVDTLFAIAYYIASPWFFWYVKNGTRAEAKKCGWFFFIGFIYFFINLIVFGVMLLFFTTKPFVGDVIFPLKYLVHPLIFVTFSIWLGIWAQILLPALLERLKDEC